MSNTAERGDLGKSGSQQREYLDGDGSREGVEVLE
jgi:hypothetical protein